MFFDTKIDKYAGIDIGDSSIKLVEISRDGEKLHLNTYAELALATYAGFVPGQAVKLGEEKLGQAIIETYRGSKCGANKFIVSIPMSACNVMHLSLPKDSLDILDTIVPLELRKYTPISVSELSVSYEKLPPNPKLVHNISDRDNINIVVLSVRSRFLESLKRSASILPGEIVSFEPSIFGALRTIKFSQTEASLVIDIGAALTTVAFLNEGVLYGTTTINIGSQDITNHIKNSLSLTFEDAEKVKKSFGLYGDKTNILLKDITILAARRISEEVIHIRNRYEMRYNTKCNEIWICGGGSRVLGIDKFLEEELKIKVNVSNAFERVDVPEVMQKMLTGESPSFTSSIGLVIARI